MGKGSLQPFLPWWSVSSGTPLQTLLQKKSRHMVCVCVPVSVHSDHQTYGQALERHPSTGKPLSWDSRTVLVPPGNPAGQETSFPRVF